MCSDDDRVTLAAFATAAVLAGGNGIGIRFSNRELDPLWGAGLRFALAAALFAALMVALRLVLPRGRAFAGVVVFGLLSSAPPTHSRTTRSSSCTRASARSCSRSCRS